MLKKVANVRKMIKYLMLRLQIFFGQFIKRTDILRKFRCQRVAILQQAHH